MQDSEELRLTAYHEAGHAAADLIFDHGVGRISIIQKDDTLGHAVAMDGDNLTAKGMANLVIALYAGAEAARRLLPKDKASAERINLGASDDDETAEGYLRHCEEGSEALRARAAELVSTHWGLVELIAEDLLKFDVLVYDEVEILHDIYKGDCEYSDLEQYRVSNSEYLVEAAPERKSPK